MSIAESYLMLGSLGDGSLELQVELDSEREGLLAFEPRLLRLLWNKRRRKIQLQSDSEANRVRWKKVPKLANIRTHSFHIE